MNESAAIAAILYPWPNWMLSSPPKVELDTHILILSRLHLLLLLLFSYLNIYLLSRHCNLLPLLISFASIHFSFSMHFLPHWDTNNKQQKTTAVDFFFIDLVFFSSHRCWFFFCFSSQFLFLLWHIFLSFMLWFALDILKKLFDMKSIWWRVMG